MSSKTYYVKEGSVSVDLSRIEERLLFIESDIKIIKSELHRIEATIKWIKRCMED